MSPNDPLALGEWRCTIAETYAAVRHLAPTDPDRAWHTFRASRDTLFKTHAQTPLSADARDAFRGLSYYPYDPQWRLIGRVNRQVTVETFNVDLPTDGRIQYTRIAQVAFSLGRDPTCLN